MAQDIAARPLGLQDPRVVEYRDARADTDKGLRAQRGAHDRYQRSIGPYLACMDEMTPAEPPIARKAMMEALFSEGKLPLVSILAAFRATDEESAYVAEHPPLEPEAIDEQQRLRGMPYGLYLKTPHWYAVRKRTLDWYEHKCIICGRTNGLEVHHRDPRAYDRRGAERPADVTVMCDVCHGAHHDKLATRRPRPRVRTH